MSLPFTRPDAREHGSFAENELSSPLVAPIDGSPVRHDNRTANPEQSPNVVDALEVPNLWRISLWDDLLNTSFLHNNWQTDSIHV
jgi:hypothetical protein